MVLEPSLLTGFLKASSRFLLPSGFLLHIMCKVVRFLRIALLFEEFNYFRFLKICTPFISVNLSKPTLASSQASFRTFNILRA